MPDFPSKITGDTGEITKAAVGVVSDLETAFL
jgi:hypothetical protein